MSSQVHQGQATGEERKSVGVLVGHTKGCDKLDTLLNHKAENGHSGPHFLPVREPVSGVKVGASVLELPLHSIFYNRKRVLDGVKHRGIRGKEQIYMPPRHQDGVQNFFLVAT